MPHDQSTQRQGPSHAPAMCRSPQRASITLVPTLTQDRMIRELSESILDAYPLDPADRAGLSTIVESLLFDLVERTDQLAALLAERVALRSRLARHESTHDD